MALLNHYFIKNIFKKSWDEIIPKDRIEEIYNLVEVELDRYAEKYGVIKLSVPYVLINSIKK